MAFAMGVSSMTVSASASHQAKNWSSSGFDFSSLYSRRESGGAVAHWRSSWKSGRRMASACFSRRVGLECLEKKYLLECAIHGLDDVARVANRWL